MPACRLSSSSPAFVSSFEKYLSSSLNVAISSKPILAFNNSSRLTRIVRLYSFNSLFAVGEKSFSLTYFLAFLANAFTSISLARFIASLRVIFCPFEKLSHCASISFCIASCAYCRRFLISFMRFLSSLICCSCQAFSLLMK